MKRMTRIKKLKFGLKGRKIAERREMKLSEFGLSVLKGKRDALNKEKGTAKIGKHQNKYFGPTGLELTYV